MNTKRQYFDEAERLYVIEQYSLIEIARKLNLSRNTPLEWKELGDWDNKRKQYLRSKQSFHEELYEFSKKLMKGISEDIDSGEKIDACRLYAFCRILPMIGKVKDYEDVVAKKKEDTPKGLTPELIAQIEEEVLGIKHNDNEE